MVMEFLEGESLERAHPSARRLGPVEAGRHRLAALVRARRRPRGGDHPSRFEARQRLSAPSRPWRATSSKIFDFGVSKFNDASTPGSMSMTRTGTIMGTPSYMSPEQARGAGRGDPALRPLFGRRHHVRGLERAGPLRGTELQRARLQNRPRGATTHRSGRSGNRA